MPAFLHCVSQLLTDKSFQTQLFKTTCSSFARKSELAVRTGLSRAVFCWGQAELMSPGAQSCVCVRARACMCTCLRVYVSVCMLAASIIPSPSRTASACASDGEAITRIAPAAVPWATVSSWLTRLPGEGREPTSRVAEPAVSCWLRGWGES